jgi:NADPH:quinone reductase-like Zn-dependent oxidoreductase
MHMQILEMSRCEIQYTKVLLFDEMSSIFRSRAGESCVVTGGAGGIGAASASLWLRCGGCAVIADVDAAAGAAFVARAPGPGRAVFVACDTRRREDLENAIAVATCAYYYCVLLSCFSLF